MIVYCRIGERAAHTWYVLTELLGYPTGGSTTAPGPNGANAVDVPIAVLADEDARFSPARLAPAEGIASPFLGSGSEPPSRGRRECDGRLPSPARPGSGPFRGEVPCTLTAALVAGSLLGAGSAAADPGVRSCHRSSARCHGVSSGHTGDLRRTTPPSSPPSIPPPSRRSRRACSTCNLSPHVAARARARGRRCAYYRNGKLYKVCTWRKGWEAIPLRAPSREGGRCRRGGAGAPIGLDEGRSPDRWSAGLGEQDHPGRRPVLCGRVIALEQGMVLRHALCCAESCHWAGHCVYANGLDKAPDGTTYHYYDASKMVFTPGNTINPANPIWGEHRLRELDGPAHVGERRMGCRRPDRGLGRRAEPGCERTLSR